MSAILKISRSTIYMFLATLFFVLAHSSIKTLQGLPLHEVIFARLIFSFVVCLFYFRLKNINFFKEMTWPLFLRGFFGAVAMVLYFYTLTVMPLATAVTINFLSPLFSMIFAIFILNEKPHSYVWFFAILALIGVFMTKGFDGSITWTDFIAAVLASMLAALAYVYVRKSGIKSEPLLVVFSLPLVGLFPATASFFIYDFVAPDFFQWIILITMSLSVFIAQIFMTLAYKYGEVAQVSLINYVTIVWSILIGYFVFNELVTGVRLLGLLLIFTSILLNEFFKAKKRMVRP